MPQRKHRDSVVNSEGGKPSPSNVIHEVPVDAGPLRLSNNPTSDELKKFICRVNIISRFERKADWMSKDIKTVTLYVPDFLEKQDNSEKYPEPPADSDYKFVSWVGVYNKYTSAGEFSVDEVKFYCALWAYLGPKGAPLQSGWSSDLKWEYVKSIKVPMTQNVTINQIEYKAETLALYGYLAWPLALRFCERNQDTPLENHAVFTSVQRFFPELQNRDLLVRLVDYTSSKLRGYFRSGAPSCASLSSVVYCPTIIADYTGTKKAYQVAKNRDIPGLESGFYGLMSIGIFMSGFSAYETMVEGLRKHRKTMQDIVSYFPFPPFIDYFNKAVEINKQLSDDPWFGLCQKLYENADTPMSANKFPVPSYVGLCFQSIEEKGMVPAPMPGVPVLDTVRVRFAAYVYYIISNWEQPPIITGSRTVYELTSDNKLLEKEFVVTEDDIRNYKPTSLYQQLGTDTGEKPELSETRVNQNRTTNLDITRSSELEKDDDSLEEI